MEPKETLLQYYQLTNKEMPKDLLSSKGTLGHFNVMERTNSAIALPFMRRDFYKICLLDDHCVLELENEIIEINKPYIFFASPDIKYGWRTLSESHSGYICMFNEEYISADIKSAFHKLYSFFKEQNSPFILLEQEEYEFFLLCFNRMLLEYRGDFEYKNEVILNLLWLIIYEGIKCQNKRHPKAKTITSVDRIYHQFKDLLERQFPVDSPMNEIKHRSASDFASELNIHVNYLNHSLRQKTGHSTTQIINERIVAEAIELLKNTDWTVTEIGNSLGFGYPQHFTKFFKKQTGTTPTLLKETISKNI